MNVILRTGETVHSRITTSDDPSPNKKNQAALQPPPLRPRSLCSQHGLTNKLLFNIQYWSWQ